MTVHHHPVFGSISVDPLEIDADERALQAKLREIRETNAAEREANNAVLLHALNLIGTDRDDDIPALPTAACRKQVVALTDDEFTLPLRSGEWEDEQGRIWDQSTHPKPHTAAKWVATTTPAPMTRYDRAFIADKNARQAFQEALESFGAFDPRTTDASAKAAICARRFKNEKVRGQQEASRRQDAIDLYRQTLEGREAYNAARRKTRAVPNANRAAMSDAERLEHNRRMEREKKRRQRDAKKTGSLDEPAIHSAVLPE